jgi:hypothetical protein
VRESERESEREREWKREKRRERERELSSYRSPSIACVDVYTLLYYGCIKAVLRRY